MPVYPWVRCPRVPWPAPARPRPPTQAGPGVARHSAKEPEYLTELRAGGLVWREPLGGACSLPPRASSRNEYGVAMSRYPDKTGAWWTEVAGNGGATWVLAAPSSAGAPAPAQDGVRGALSRRALGHGLVIPPSRRERTRRGAISEWRHQKITAIREPSLKSGVITVGSGFGGTGKTDVAVTLAAIYAAARAADRV